MNPISKDSDIFWRDIQEDDSIFHQDNKDRAILILTNVADTYPRNSLAKYVDIFNNRDNSCNEFVKFYAFLT
jgi:hypothetical protein